LLGVELEASKETTSPVRILFEGEKVNTARTSASELLEVSSKTQPASVERTITEERSIGKKADFMEGL
jgi:hypothetical protein